MSCDCPDGRISRRAVLTAAALGGVVTLGSPLVPVQAAFGAAGVATDTLVVLFLRGGADWLSLLPPVGDPTYAPHRPTIAVPAGTAIPLDQTFALNPGLAALQPFWRSGTLAFLHAVGSPDPTRSHFDAQRAIELGGHATTGWLDRYLQAVHGRGAFDAVAHGSATPVSLAGPAPTLAIADTADFGLPNWLGSSYADALAGQFSGVSHPLGRQAHDAFGAIRTAKKALAHSDTKPDNGARYPSSGLGSALADVARLVKAGLGTRVVTVDHSGWDMHTNLGRDGGLTGGQMHTQAADLGNALAAFATDLGPRLADVTLVTVTDFGRRVTENASGGLDHGHGQGMLLLGGGVRGGRITTRWPGLANGALDNGDLAGTIDLRSVLASLLATRMAARADQLRSIFPGWQPESLDLAAPR
jgi:uncharacterized protein (DUF1501 family)